MTIAEAVAWGRAQLAPQHARDAELLLRAATGGSRAWLLAHPEGEVAEAAWVQYRESMRRRSAGEPVQHILGTQEFWGRSFSVTKDVLIPRPETEHLVEAVLARTSKDAPLRIADIGTGSGVLAITLALELPNAAILATDISQAALQIASSNSHRHGVAPRITFQLCDLLPPDLDMTFDCIVSNPPYIAESDRSSLATEVRDHEPAIALFGGPDGLEVYRRLIPAAWQALKPGGWLVMEIGAGQHPTLVDWLTPWQRVSCQPDLQGIPRVLIARKA